jgi:VWFA-related protein
MYVSVVDQAGAPVPNLTPSDFVVREDNVAREVLRVEPATEPMQIAILVDTSNNSRRDIPYIKDALPGFVKTLMDGVKNQIALIGFGERPTIFADYSSRPKDVEKGLSLVWSTPQSHAMFLDAILETSQGLKKREAGRPNIVAIVSEGPESSFRYYDQVLGPLRASGAAFHVVLLGTPFLGSNDESRSRNIVLDEGTRTTGGSRTQLLTAQSLKSRLAQLADVLLHEYRVTYARPQTLIPPQKVTVSAKNPALTARGTPANDSGKQ